MSRIAAIVAVSLALVACDDGTSPDRAEVTAELTLAGMVVENGRDAPIHYFTVERATAALIDWLTCVDDSRGPCPSIDPHASLLIPYHDIPGWGPDAEEVLFYWWHAVPDPEGGLVTDSVRLIIVGD